MINGWQSNGDWVVPLNDLRPHLADNAECPCQPFYDGRILVHNSFDGRESFERGERKVS